MAPCVSYYNENDVFAAAWLRSLIARGLIAPGEVDERSIVDGYGNAIVAPQAQAFIEAAMPLIP